ncbi:MAG: ACT domain-containing protein, partial [Candidatus Aenigmarchaeota archaeon]|nr:ACT domain-containing protein [Candidatus Aenigmarchaeota archaeon]
RVDLKHIPGSLAEASTILARHGFNIEDSIQRKRFSREVDGEIFIPDIITSEQLPYRTVDEALRELEKSDRTHDKPFYLRFEE